MGRQIKDNKKKTVSEIDTNQVEGKIKKKTKTQRKRGR